MKTIVKEILSWKELRDLRYQAGDCYRYQYPELKETVRISILKTVEEHYQAHHWFEQDEFIEFEFKQQIWRLGVYSPTVARFQGNDILSMEQLKSDVENDVQLFHLPSKTFEIIQSNYFELRNIQTQQSYVIEEKRLKEAMLQVLLQIESY